jgi:hypothetical protein
MAVITKDQAADDRGGPEGEWGERTTGKKAMGGCPAETLHGPFSGRFAWSASLWRTCQSAMPSLTSTTYPQERQVYSRQTSPVKVFLSVWWNTPPHFGQALSGVDAVMGRSFEVIWPEEGCGKPPMGPDKEYGNHGEAGLVFDVGKTKGPHLWWGARQAGTDGFAGDRLDHL